jgi:hypothetical protein
MQMPNSKLLKWLMGWMILAACLKIANLSQTANQSAERVVANYLSGLVLHYVFGAFWSELAHIYVPAMIAGAVFVIAAVTRGSLSKAAAKFAFIAILYLSLFCIWIEPWLTASGLITVGLLMFFHLSLFLVDAGVSVAWLFLWGFATEAINHEL